VEASIRQAFSAAAQQILGEIGFAGVQVEEGTASGAGSADYLAVLGLVGGIKGHLVVRFANPVAGSFVGGMSRHLGMNAEEDPHYRKAALGEIVNQIGGRATALLGEVGIDCLITPPTVIAGIDVDAALPESHNRCWLGVSGEFGTFHCVIALKNA
jgi:CheY-specific phosphatase CheX